MTAESKSKWYKTPWAKVVSTFTGVAFIFGTGFTVGVYYYEIKSNSEIYTIKQNYEKELSEEREKRQRLYAEFFIDNLEKLEKAEPILKELLGKKR